MVKLNAVLAVDMKKFNKNNNNLTPRLRLLNSEIGWCDFEMVMTCFRDRVNRWIAWLGIRRSFREDS